MHATSLTPNSRPAKSFAPAIDSSNRLHDRYTACGAARNFEYPMVPRRSVFTEPEADDVSLELTVPPLVVMTAAGSLAGLIASVTPALSLELAVRTWLAAGIGLLGLACILSGVAAFRRARTTVNPLKPAAASALVVSGIYRVTRNPMYLGFLLLLLAEIVWLANAFALLAAPALVLYLNFFQIGPEEKGLRHRFGPEYSRYAARVRRWL